MRNLIGTQIMEEIARVTNGNWKPGCPVNVKEYSIDSRSVMNPEHTLFFALKGKNHDGHDYIAPLYDSGVRAFVVSEWRKEFDALAEANFIVVADVLAALQALAAASMRGRLFSVVGSAFRQFI